MSFEALCSAIAAPSLLLVSLLSDLLKRYSINADYFLERRRVIQWGLHRGIPYVLVQLPSWDWRLCFDRDDYRWHRRVLLWKENQGWTLHYLTEEAA